MTPMVCSDSKLVPVLVPLALALAPLTLACNGGGGGESIYTMTNGTDPGTATVPTVDPETSDSNGDGDGDEGDGDGDPGDGDPGPKLDVVGDEEGMMTAGDVGDGDGSQKVDFLFVIDNSGSMLEEQTALSNSFPAFINSIQSTLDQAQEYHIMVIDTDHWVHAGCALLCGFPPLPGLCVGYECGVTVPEQCEDILGAGVTHPKGADASNMDCNFQNGLRFMTDQEPNLVGAFQCAARVGTGSTDDPERPMEAMVQAVGNSPQIQTCNNGFLRDDAILVVTFITDEDDNAGDGSSGDVNTWRQALIDAKNGDDTSIVALGLFGGNGCAEDSPRLTSFVDSWGDKGFYGSICSNDYDAFFQEAVDIIDTTCDEFTPPQ